MSAPLRILSRRMVYPWIKAVTREGDYTSSASDYFLALVEKDRKERLIHYLKAELTDHEGDAAYEAQILNALRKVLSDTDPFWLRWHLHELKRQELGGPPQRTKTKRLRITMKAVIARWKRDGCEP